MSTTQPREPGSSVEAVPTPTGGLLLAPRGRRRDHVLVAVVGTLLAPALLALSQLAATWSQQGRWAHALAAAGVILVISSGAQALFAARSSLGGLVTGLVALLPQAVILADAGGAGAPAAWAHVLNPSGMALVLAGLALGGSWAMRQARQAGREEARHARAQAQADRTPGVTPTAPPGRRRDHVLSFPVVALCVVSALYLQEYARIVTGSWRLPTLQGYGLLACSLVLLVIGAAAAGRSTLGARVVGPLLAVTGLALLASGLGDLPGRDLLVRFGPADATGIVLVSTGLVLASIGWGVHLARRQGRMSQAQLRRSQAPASR